LDLGTIRALLKADMPRVRCRVHGVVVASVPWARHDAGHTYAFDETVAWLATQSAKSTVTELMRIAWCTVGSIITRADVEVAHDRFAGLRPQPRDPQYLNRRVRPLAVTISELQNTARFRLAGAVPAKILADMLDFSVATLENYARLSGSIRGDYPALRDTTHRRCP
jgi:transposase